MAFKLNNPPYTVDNTPIYKVDMEEGVMGKANNNGSILLSKNLSPLEAEKVINHEKIHLEQMKRGDLDYDDKYVYWKGKKYSRAQMQEGAKNLPWEAEAYRRA
jgi:hypothetical protein